MKLTGLALSRVKRAREELGARNRPRQFPWTKKGLTRPERVVKFLQFLPITKGPLAGHPMKLLPEQREFIDEIYGKLDAAGRRVRRLGIKSEPKGNGKTGLIAGLCLCHLLGPESEPRGEVYSAAIDRQQAGLIYNEMEAIITAVPEFSVNCNLQRFHKRVEIIDGVGKGSLYEALSADARRAHGLSPSLFAYDELAQAKDRVLLDNLVNGLGKRKEALGLIISTQAADDTHALSQLIDDALTKEDPSLYVQLISAPHDADPFDEATWKACNPALGKFLSLPEMREAANRAHRAPAFEPSFRNLRLNQRIDANDENRIVTPAVWKLGAVPVDLSKLLGKTCYGGLDLSGKHDLTALLLAFPDAAGGFDLVPYFWTPIGQLSARQPNEQALFRQWIKDGHMIAVPGPVIEFQYVAAQIAALAGQFKIACIGYDRWRVDELRHELSKLGAVVEMEPFGQGYKDMSPAVENFAELALSAKLRHGGHPVLNACVANAILTKPDDAGNQKFAKGKANESTAVRIDGVVAAAMALGTAKRKAVAVQPINLSSWLSEPAMAV